MSRRTEDRHLLWPSSCCRGGVCRTVKRANKALEAAGYRPLPLPSQPGAITNHSLRRTQVTLLAEANAPINYIMQQAGHTSPQMTLGLYAKVMNRDRSDVGERVQELLDGAAFGRAEVEARNDGDATDAAIAELLAEH